jgi:ABC-type Zn uptake system ZnuABC Zn-binding protein ZnuA
VATTPIVGDLATQVSSDDVEVTTLLSADTDPHEYEPRPEDIEALAEADLVVASGGDLDEWISGALDDSGSAAESLDLTERISPGLIDDDPHWWQDPRRAGSAAAAIADSIGELDDPDSDAISAEARDYLREIHDTDAAIESCFESVPVADRKLVTDHDAFGYLADRYDIEIVGAVIPATTTEAQASAGELAELRETIEREDVKAVFPEASVTTDLAEAIADETGATADYELYGDSLGPEGSGAETYLGMIRANANALVRGFTGGERGCEA